MKKPSVLMMMQLPPPAHGAALINERLTRSTRINAEFDVDVLPVQLARSIEDTSRPAAGKLLRLGANAMRLLSRLFVRRPDVVLYTLPSSGYAFMGGMLLLAIVKALQVPHILQMRCRGIADTGRRSHLHRTLCRWAFARASVVLISPHVLDDVSEYANPERIHYVPDGIADPDPAAKRRADGPSRVPHILFLSHLFETKGPLVLLAALQRLKHRGVPFRATFVGEPADVTAAMMRQHIRTLDLAAEVRYAGPAYGPAKEAYFLSAHIFAFPTFYPMEVFPNVLLEAMAYGLPLVTTGEAAIPEIVVGGLTGEMVPARDPDALADALERLALDPDLRRRMGAAARARFLDRFQFGQCEERLAKVLRHLSDREALEDGDVRLRAHM